MGLGAWGLGFGVWGWGLGVQAAGFGVWGLGFGVWCVVCGVWCLGFGVWDLGFRVDLNRRSSSRRSRARCQANTPVELCARCKRVYGEFLLLQGKFVLSLFRTFVLRYTTSESGLRSKYESNTILSWYMSTRPMTPFTPPSSTPPTSDFGVSESYLSRKLKIFFQFPKILYYFSKRRLLFLIRKLWKAMKELTRAQDALVLVSNRPMIRNSP